MKKILILTSDFYRGEIPLESDLMRLKEKIVFEISPDYLDFIEKFDGGEGIVGEKYLALWKINDVVETDEFYKKEDYYFYENYLIFGSNSGVFTYAFNKKNSQIEELDLYDDSYKRIMGKSIEDLITMLVNEIL